ncbi:sensory protein [Ahniella affigens]|uniref:Sensory protein n=1 Tax=Ahniella affigens TaxID=2021234 RepID=A0A2P1PR44_9GAMM|nr:TspO/MBR family protein [Ahniella affigens]AVP97302.1 sensory protein [Ahniella affigens]
MSPPRPLWQSVLGLCSALVCCFGVAAIGAFGSMNAPSFYTQLQQPSWAPPAWLFGPVWTVLYALMAVSVWRVWQLAVPGKSGRAVLWFSGHLVLNGLWSWVFFAWQAGGWAMVNITALWLSIALCMRLFWPISRAASLLLLPYLAWVTFASVLNWAMWRLNPGLL